MMIRTHLYGLIGLMLYLVLGGAMADENRMESEVRSPGSATFKKDGAEGSLRNEQNQNALVPDLILSGPEVEMHRLSVVSNTCDVTLKTKVKNVGNFTAGSSDIGYYVDNKWRGDTPVGPLGSGHKSGKKSLSLHGKKKAVSHGGHTFEFNADDKGAVAESNEGNNTKTISCKCGTPTKSHICK